MISESLARVVSGETLSRAEMRALVCAIAQDEESDVVIAALLAALRTRGETIAEIAGAAEALRDLAIPLPEAPVGAVDTCGTGGDGANTFNISTVAALVVAGAGVPVAKHGNRAATSRCGSAEVLEALGVNLEVAPARMAEAVAAIGIGFLFARACHPAMARVAPIRAALGVPTIFNRLGPLTNPMRPRHQLLGVGQADTMDDAAAVLAELGAECVWVVHGADGLDEVSTCARTRVVAWQEGQTRTFTIEPGELVPVARLEDLAGGDASTNAAIARDVLAGKTGPRRDVVLVNAGAALCVAGHARDLEEGVLQAAEAIDSGQASGVLDRWVEFTAAGT